MYHSISNTADPRFKRFTLAPSDFDDHLGYLTDNDYHPITLSALGEAQRTGRPLPEKPVVLTFDDGFADFYTIVAPRLAAVGFSATLYVATGFIESTSLWLGSSGEGGRPMLTWPQVREVAELGIEIGSHTHSHPELDRCSVDDVIHEIRRSRRDLEHQLDQAVTTFAYPFGYWSSKVRDVVADEGFTTAVQVGELTSRQQDDSLSIPRLSVDYGTTAASLAALLASHQTRVSRAVSASKRVVWQGMRRHLPIMSTTADEGARALA
jgi:peptidoglycan/xylan/chitin deacetylase (PgdA/CDA1 family)